MALLYDAFISYSHAKDRPVATALQSVIQKLGKPWYRRRALRVFRDDTSLSATPQLWPSIEQALRQSCFFILIASPEAAASKWVGREVAFWLEHNSVDTLLLGLTEGELVWDEAAGAFMAGTATPLPEPLRGRFASEPKWIDLRAYRVRADPRHAGFIEAGADFAATIRGMPKEDLLSQEVRQQRRALTLAWSAACSLLVLAGLAGWQWREALTQRDRAERTLAQATETTNELVYDLAERFRHAGLPASLVREVLDRARALQEQLVGGGYATPALRRNQGLALLATVKTLLTLGDTTGAVAAAERARRIFEQLLAAGDREVPSLQHSLAVSYGQIGDALFAQGENGEALKNLRLAVAALERLVASDRANAVWQRHLAIALTRVGAVLLDLGDYDDALKHFREGLAIRERLARNSEDPVVQHGLATAHAAVGDALGQIGLRRRNAGDRVAFAHGIEEALANYRKSLGILERVAVAAPNNTAWQRDLAVAYNKVGEALAMQGRFVDQDGGQQKLVEALASYRQGIAILERLAGSDRSNVGWRLDLAATHRDVGDVLQVYDRPEEAFGSFAAALRLLVDLDAAAARRALTSIGDKIDEVMVKLVLKRSFAQALAAADRALALAPERVSFHAGRAHALMFLDRFEEARALYLRYAGRANVRREKSWEASILDDFARFQQAGLTRLLMLEIGGRFSSRG